METKHKVALSALAFSAAIAREQFLANLAIAGEPIGPKKVSKVVSPEKGKPAPKLVESPKAAPKPVENPAIDWNQIRKENPAPPVNNREIPPSPKPAPIPTSPNYSAETFAAEVVEGIATVLVWAWDLVKSLVIGVGKGLYDVTIKQPVVGVILDAVALFLGYKVVRGLIKAVFGK